VKIPFVKYQGTGNDFVLIDQREQVFLTRNDVTIIEKMCDRRFGIGADGLMLLQKKEGFDFEMVYFNADGRESSMCGNGGRCIVAFAKSLNVFDEKCHFLAIDGPHDATINAEGNQVELKMIPVRQVEIKPDFYLMNTGSPHYVRFVEQMADIDVFEDGKKIRYSERFAAEGVNVNFVVKNENGIEVATYERGVEDETFSCGTGVTAAAIAYAIKNTTQGEIAIKTKGGNLSVRLESDGYIGFTNIWLCGPATKVFEGEIETTYS
jgi:diaminopimelate epimerase